MIVDHTHVASILTPMVTITTVKKDGSIVLPKSARRSWRNAKVSVNVTGNTALITRIEKSTPTLTQMADEMRAAAKATGLTRKDIADAIREVRRNRRR